MKSAVFGPSNIHVIGSQLILTQMNGEQKRTRRRTASRKQQSLPLLLLQFSAAVRPSARFFLLAHSSAPKSFDFSCRGMDVSRGLPATNDKHLRDSILAY